MTIAGDGFTFLNDTVTTPEIFEALTVIEPDTAALIAAPRGVYRTRIARDGAGTQWHVVGVTYFNGIERPLASRIRFGRQQQEGDK